jgi:hypothetical protein
MRHVRESRRCDVSALGNLVRAIALVPGELAAIAASLSVIAREMREARRLASLRVLATEATCGECGARGTYVTHSKPATNGSHYINGWQCAAHKTEESKPHGAAAFTDSLVRVARAQLRDMPGVAIETDGAT